MKTDTLTPIGHALQTFDGQRLVTRTWRVIQHLFVDAIGRVCEMVVLENVAAVDREETK